MASEAKHKAKYGEELKILNKCFKDYQLHLHK